jgi:predicted nucleotidyltransferase component of viral defense system
LAEIRVPTIEAFAAMKLNAWHDRRAPRDLYDLHALHKIRAINDEAKKLYRDLGPGVRTQELFVGAATPAEWDEALSHRCRPTVGPDEALNVVRNAWMTT